MPSALCMLKLHGTGWAKLKYRVDSTTWSPSSIQLKFEILGVWKTEPQNDYGLKQDFLYKLSQACKKLSSGSCSCRRSCELIICQKIVLMYTTYRPNMNFILQLEVIEPEFMYFWEYSVQFLRRFIKETLSKLVCELLNFGHKNPKLQPNWFLCPSCRIDSIIQFCPPQSMKFQRV